MEQSVCNEIESLVKSNIMFRFGLELSGTEDPDRKKNIQTILQKFGTRQHNESVKEKREKMFNDIDKAVFKQKWSKLSDHHKEIKIKEYIDQKYEKHKNKNQLTELLLSSLKEGKFKTDKFIKYDPRRSNITEICHLVESEENFYFEEKKIKKKSVTEKIVPGKKLAKQSI
ncbi:hypothetical protein Catovirus_2_193 [Catovirus CTV1]|uniref:Uncharacterized protein n=1 Tax=Catovirus CTV1 TaxID=1977631 RepID=A0A1V0SC48_9VIRU|nr:hypothetical protein Catovirus_2_193 [Catovirus CTV1]